MKHVLPVWTLQEAIEFIRKLDPMLRLVGYTTALTGSILYRGFSHKDLDIMVYPLSSKHPNPEGVKLEFERIGMTMLKDILVTQASWAARGSDDKKCVEIWADDRGRRIDIFYVS